MNKLENEKYKKAKKKVKDIKGFYSHLTVYLLVNIFLILIQMGLFSRAFFEFGFEMPSWSMLSTPFFWGIGLAFHAFHVFHDRVSFFKNWEERKIKEFMEKDEEELKRTNKWD